MIIKYEFADGSVSLVEVSDELGLEIQRMDREEESYQRKQRRYGVISMDHIKYQGMEFADPNTREAQEELEESQARVDAFKATLTQTQLEVLELLEDGLNMNEIAIQKELNYSSVYQTVSLIRKKFKKFFK